MKKMGLCIYSLSIIILFYKTIFFAILVTWTLLTDFFILDLVLFCITLITILIFFTQS